MPSRVLLERWFARNYNWTPAQVAELPLDALTWFPVIEQAESNAQAIKQKENSRKPVVRRGLTQGVT